MQLVFHAGAHFTEGERLLKCLLRNKDTFRDRGIVVPGPGRYRKLLRETLNALGDAPPAESADEVLLEAILDAERADRVLLSNAHFFGVPRAAVRKGLLYPKAADRMAFLAQIFYRDDLELCMAVRNPATFLPKCLHKSMSTNMPDFLGGVDPRAVRWSDTIMRLREAVPDVPITVWCNEDAPLIWPQIIREIAGLEHGETVVGGYDLIAEIMSKEGMARFATYLKSKPNMNEIQIKRVMAAFLGKYALDDAIDEEIDTPGWTNDLVDELSDIYDEDVLTIERIPGVEVISP